VTFLDRIDGVEDVGACLRWSIAVLDALGLGADHAILGENSVSLAGLPRAEVLRRARRSALVLDVNGYLGDEEIVAAAACRVFLDIDPGWSQIWRALGLTDHFTDHHAHVTVGTRVGRDGCAIPTCGLDWIATAPPVVLDAWPASAGGTMFTSVGTWRGPYGTIEYDGVIYGSRVHEFRAFVTLPRLANISAELALDIHAADATDRHALLDGGWRLTDPAVATADPATYRTYVQSSLAEICVAQSMYVRTASGWLSDRSACYLASGKPVVAQDTGLADAYPTGTGLVTFSTLDEAVAAVGAIRADPARHARAARAFAEEHLDSDRVITRLCDILGVS
jgi:hypothetical protein